MRISILFTLALTFIAAQSSSAQRIFVTNKRCEADKIVYMSKYFSESSLVICRTFNIQDTARGYHWFFVDNRQDSDLIIFYTKRMEEANEIVFYTNRKGLLGSYCAHSKVDEIIPPTRAYTLTPQE